jgi:hypothetical protein
MISIAERLRPFSHLPGSKCLIPGTGFLVEAYPALVRVFDFDGNLIKEVTLDVQGPLKQFTVMQDLERGCVTIFCELYHVHILPTLEVTFQKNPPLPPLPIKERLSLGSHKKQEWEGIKKRCDFREIFPLWFRLGQLIDLPVRRGDERGTFSLLKSVQACLDAHQPEKILKNFEKLFLAGFKGMLIPRSYDEEYQGILPQESQPSEDSPLYLLKEASLLIRSLFLLNGGNEISILPNLPPEFPSGRMVNLACPPFGTLDLEWSKKTARRIYFRASAEGEIIFHLPSPLKQFRVRSGTQDRGKILKCGDSLEIKSGSHYLLDRFQK